MCSPASISLPRPKGATGARICRCVGKNKVDRRADQVEAGDASWSLQFGGYDTPDIGSLQSSRRLPGKVQPHRADSVLRVETVWAAKRSSSHWYSGAGGVGLMATFHSPWSCILVTVGSGEDRFLTARTGMGEARSSCAALVLSTEDLDRTTGAEIGRSFDLILDSLIGTYLAFAGLTAPGSSRKAGSVRCHGC